MAGGGRLSRADRRRKGAMVASLLAGSWREDPPASGAIPDLDELAPLLHRSGSAALAWARLGRGALAGDPAVEGLRQAHRLQTLGAALHRRHIVHVLEVFRAHGVDPVIVKGWAAARLYPAEGLRPTGDIDVCVRPHEEADARRALAAVTADCSVDLHVGWAFLDDRDPDEVRRRCQEAGIDGVRARVLGPEDHLRLMAVHMLGHGAWRPVWLVDLAVVLETRPAGLDWEWFRAGSRRRSEWAAMALRLAHLLLGAALDGVPADVTPAAVPRWVTDAVLDAWGDHRREPQGARLAMRHLRGPRAVVDGLRRRWPDALEATVGVGASMGTFPRWPLQLAECVMRTARFARTLMGPRRPVVGRLAAPALTGSHGHR
ncbi:MAG TPA: nucleotidyltransferase family protein [Vicinamibacteria bacterium]|nr:nucleotidyltransferase family protein [Vicinamibacteria bacterium]